MQKAPPVTAIVLMLLMALLPASNTSAEPISYNRDIRPILSDKCFSCHGPDNQHRSADLRLDVTENGENYDGAYLYAIVPGDVQASVLTERIHHTKDKFVMPPPETGLSLTDKEKRLLEDWIKQGAKYEKHWSFEPIEKTDPPAVKDKDWPRNTIDQFVLAELERQGLEPSEQTDKRTLLRRLTLDLTGLPPTPAELDAFVSDDSADAYEKQVDRLLASPRFGERMAVPWLDAARYADTNGFSIDDHRDMWLWREWVIDAYNRNMPYDQFLTHQLAGDLLPDATDQTRLATGFLRNSMNTHEGGTIPEEYRVIYIADKVDTVSTVFMGLTMRCAQCHDHKYDELSIREYYQMYAFFDTAHEPGMGATNANTPPIIRMDGLLTPADQYKQDLEQRIATLERYLMHPPELVKPRAQWEQQARDDAEGELAAALTVPADQRDESQWKTINEAFAKTTRLWGRHQSTIQREIAILKKDLEAGQSSVMVMKEQGPRQTYVLTRGQYDQPDKDRPVSPGVPGVLPPIGFKPPTSDNTAGDQAARFDPWEQSQWVWDHPAAAVDAQNNAPLYFRYTFTLDNLPEQAILRATADNRCTTYLNGNRLGKNETWMTPARYDVSEHLVKGQNVIAIKAANNGGVAGLLASLVVDGKQLLGTGKHWKVTAKAETNWTSSDFNDKQWQSATELGPAGMNPWQIGPASEKPDKTDPTKPNRLHLARWLTRPDHPLTARVAVNRVWQMLLGQGLVTTPNDFGNQGAYPSHPGLLDTLAKDFVDNGWDTKRLIKQIVMSATYRQSSDVSPGLLERDPNNRLLARMARFRLPAEFIRDSALAISGQLDPRIGGPSVYPAQPHGLWREVSHFGYPRAFTAQAFYPSDETGLTRRSMYTFWKRTSPPPSLSAFDAPSREVCTVERARTNTPLQALVLLNDPEYFEAATSLAELARAQKGDNVEQRIAYMFRRATARRPDAWEQDVLVKRYNNALQRYTQNVEATRDAVGSDDPELAALTSVASIILNLDETITRE